MPSNESLEANERMRWGSMDRARLLTRLGRITKPEKLAWFMRLAREHRDADLFRAAADRARDLGVRDQPEIRWVTDHLPTIEWEFGRQDDAVTSRAPAREEPPVVDLRNAIMREVKKTKKPTVRKIRF